MTSDSEVESDSESPPSKQKRTSSGSMDESAVHQVAQDEEIVVDEEALSVNGSTNGDSHSEGEVVWLDPEPLILFARGARERLKPETGDTAVGRIWKTKSYRVFQRPKSERLAETHSLILSEPNVDKVVNNSLPKEYQGSGFFAVKIKEGVVEKVKKVLDLLKRDGNRTWSQRTRTWCQFKRKNQTFHVFVVYYDHSCEGFRKTVSFIVERNNSRRMDFTVCYIAVVRYYWSKGVTPKSFDPSKYREEKLGEYFKKELASKFDPKLLGPSTAPRHALQEVIKETPAEIIQINPSFQISSR
ncbi:uncharacterized protein LOC129590911 [Paramacrobiotus metropolitanus]|uniref:uncharacterized protein LOC129590911 n=1 Tax=Paramacrobiotus metropolitanus TaxID=2943436 RepID=UPI002446461E|nr:uncharacterized protein LOC129590911 [Paramacrobiotus metropolitanus]